MKRYVSKKRTFPLAKGKRKPLRTLVDMTGEIPQPELDPVFARIHQSRFYRIRKAGPAIFAHCTDCGRWMVAREQCPMPEHLRAEYGDWYYVGAYLCEICVCIEERFRRLARQSELAKIRCAACGSPVSAKRITARFCSSRCRLRAWRTRTRETRRT